MNLHGFLKLRPLIFVTALLLMCQPAWATKRVALVIGNSTYKNAAQLLNPANDAAIVAARLKSAGFDFVDSRLDLIPLDDIYVSRWGRKKPILADAG